MHSLGLIAYDVAIGKVDALVSSRTGFSFNQLSSILAASRPNVLVVGSEADADLLLTLLSGKLPPPVFSISCAGGEIVLPPGGGRVVLQDVSALSAASQRALLDWFDSYVKACQTLALTRQPLWPMVKQGRFLRRLFYRLNTLTLHVAPTDEAESID